MTVAAKQWLAMYRERDRLFDRMPEPQWRMLLDLIANGPASVTSLCLASGAPPTTALRHLSELERAEWIVREADRQDSRRFHLHLTPEAADLLMQTRAA